MVAPGGPQGGTPDQGLEDDQAAINEAAAAQRALSTKLVAMCAARRAYLRAVHLEPSSGLLWGDLGGSCHQEAQLLQLQLQQVAPGSDADAAAAAAAADGEARMGVARARAERLVQGGLRLAPADAWLWRQLGAVASDPAVVEYALGRFALLVAFTVRRNTFTGTRLLGWCCMGCYGMLTCRLRSYARWLSVGRSLRFLWLRCGRIGFRMVGWRAPASGSQRVSHPRARLLTHRPAASSSASHRLAVSSSASHRLTWVLVPPPATHHV